MKIRKGNFYRSLLVTVVSLTVMLTSCTDLVDTSYDEIVTRNFEPSGDDVASIVGQAYVPWRQLMLGWNGLWRAQEISADQLVIPARPNGWVDGGVYRQFHEHRWTADHPIVGTVWSRAYSGITTTNRIIYQIESGDIQITEGREETLAELRVVRASYYYVLLDLYGNVPIVEDFDVPEGFLPEQSSRKEVFDFVVKEIEESLPMLSEENNNTTYGRFNKWAAHTLLAKVYLNAEVYTGTPQWEKVIEHTDAVINSGAGYLLEPNQKNPFVTENQNSNEIIFSIPIDAVYQDEWNTFDLHLQTLQPSNAATYNLQETPWGGICAIPQFINIYDEDDARYKDNWIKGQQYSSTGEPIMAQLGAYSGEPLAYINELPGIDQSEAIHGFRLGKFEIAMGSTNILDNDYPLLRYADVLMMKAEALLRTDRPDEAASIVTEIRMRNFDDPTKAEVTGAELLQGSEYDYGLRNHLEETHEGGNDIKFGRFLDELGREFAQEGRRRQDLIRFGVFTTKSWLSHSASQSDEFRKLFPIPSDELNTNSNLTQNPGYLE